MTRKENNMEILRILKEYFERPENEDIRFFQGLSIIGLFNKQLGEDHVITGIDDPFFQDSANTLQKIKQSVHI